ncbi:MAG: redoxin domain-containing protein [Chitinophagaceae bacterium]|nr:MAG: redoxin domain-containing protein [Chitinophagaceae bacterium]
MKNIISINASKYLLFLLVLVGQCSCKDKEPLKTGLEGKPMPVFSMLLADSITYLNSATFPVNRPSLVYFFSSTCPFCRAQMKDIAENMEAFKDSHLFLVTNSVEDIKVFEKRYGLSQHENITIGMDSAYVLQDYYKVRAVPYLVVFNKDKKLTRAFTGKTSTHQLTSAMHIEL